MQDKGKCCYSVVLLDGESNFALNVVRCLVAVKGVSVHVLSKSHRVPLRYSRKISSFRIWNGLSDSDINDGCSAISKQYGADLCMAVDENTIAQLSRGGLTQACTPLPNSSSMETARDKWRFSQFLSQNGLPQPETVLCQNSEEGVARIRNLRFPVLLKPRKGSNGIGIRKFDEPESLIAYLSANPKLWEETIAQVAVPGYDIDCSVICESGQVRGATVQRGFTQQRNFRSPGGIEFVHDHDVLNVAQRLVASLKWNGIAHVDMRYDLETRTVNVIELNPRFWGSIVGSLHAGVNFPHIACLLGLGRTFDEPKFRNCRYVAGGTALSIWASGRISKDQAGFELGDTLFHYALSDLLPTIMEISWSTWATALRFFS